MTSLKHQQLVSFLSKYCFNIILCGNRRRNTIWINQGKFILKIPANQLRSVVDVGDDEPGNVDLVF